MELSCVVDDRTKDLRLRVLPVPQRIGWALDNQFATLAKLREGAVFLDDPESDTGNRNASAAWFANLLKR